NFLAIFKHFLNHHRILGWAFTVTKVGGKDIEPVTHWFPISQIKSMTTSPPSEMLDDADMIEVADWICRSKELT
ncbi:hypothetical protein M3M33_16935, partial [Loigolactobacillus coryniformis]|uniref:hypothetical protein n=1 Tax=Loigolactobacillus coryniformis TaxID=1610 RepID=UPI00201A50D6